MIENQSENFDNKENDLSDQDTALEESSSSQQLTTENNELSSQKTEEINTEELKNYCLAIAPNAKLHVSQSIQEIH